MVGVTNRPDVTSGDPYGGPIRVAPSVNGGDPERIPPGGRRSGRLRRTLLTLAALVLIAAAFALVVAALQPAHRPTNGRSVTTVANAPPSSAPGASNPSGSAKAPLDAGAVGRSIDQRLAVTRQIEKGIFGAGWLVMAGTVLLMGIAVFLLVVYPTEGDDSSPFEGHGRIRGLVVAITVVTVVAALAELPLRAAVQGDRGWVGATDPELLLFVLAGPVAVAVLLRIAGVVLILAMLVGRFTTVKRPFSVVRGGMSMIGGLHVSGLASRRAAMSVGIAVTLSSFVVVGHAQASNPRVLTMLADVVHALAASVWLGGVAMLALLLRRLRRVRKASPVDSPSPELYEARRQMAAVVGRFSVTATIALAAVTVAGTALALTQLTTVEALYKTSYGVTLVAKLVMVGFVMLLGGYNHRFLVPRVLADETDERAWRRMRHTVQLETFVIMVGVLGATVALASGGFAALLRT